METASTVSARNSTATCLSSAVEKLLRWGVLIRSSNCVRERVGMAVSMGPLLVRQSISVHPQGARISQYQGVLGFHYGWRHLTHVPILRPVLPSCQGLHPMRPCRSMGHTLGQTQRLLALTG